jgi:hypothetical protein
VSGPHSAPTRAASASVRACSPPPRGQGHGSLRACHPWNARASCTASYRSEMTAGPSPVSCARRARWPPYHGIEAGVPSPRLPIKPAQRPEPHRPRTGRHCTDRNTRRRHCLCAPLRSRSSDSCAAGQHPFAAPPRPYKPTSVARAPSLTGRPSEQRAPRPGSLGAVGRPSTGAPPPICGHESTVAKPLDLPHPIPGQGRHRSGPISTSRAALHAQGLHCFSFINSRVFFVKQGPIRDRNRSSRTCR